MQTIKLKSKWGTLISVRDHQIKKSLDQNKNVKFIYDGDEMILTAEQLKNPARSIPQQDKFSTRIDNLLYFNWKPIDKRQGVLLVW